MKTVQKQLKLRIKRIIYKKNKIDIDVLFCYKRKHKESIRNNKLVLKTQQGFKSERHIVFTEEINNIALS